KVVALDKKFVELDGKVVALSGDVASLNDKYAALSGDVASLGGKYADLSGDVASLRETVTGLEKKMDIANERTTNVERSMREGFKSVGDKIDGLSRDVGRVLATVTEATDSEIIRLQRRMTILSGENEEEMRKNA
ncbi:MAG: hypothetical protein Q4G52_12800, partial [Clostridia bacterium]|nr:hypothetical protein [Clostridia bacterium]